MKSTLSKEEKRRFNSLIYAAQDSETKMNFTDSLNYYQSALHLVPNHPKLPIKIEQIKDKIEKAKLKVDSKNIVDASGFVYNSSQNRFFLNKGYWLPGEIFSLIMPHQRVAIKWLWEHHLEKEIHGCVLGDDMGLGKTIELLVFVFGLYNSADSKHFLIVVPAMVALQWQNEAKKWAPGITFYNVHGMTPSDRRAAIKSIQTDGGILLTTYNLVQNDEASIEKSIWDYIILDEAHVIKSKIAKVTSTLKGLKAKHKISATGTPMMNNLMELWNLMDFTTDGCLLGECSAFQNTYERIISKANLKNEESSFAKTRLQELSKRIGPYILRRTKADVFKEKQSVQKEELEENEEEKEIEENEEKKDNDFQLSVKKYELIVWVKLDYNQRDIYKKLLNSINIGELGGTYMRVVLGMINYLEKACSNPPAIKNDDEEIKPFIDDDMLKKVDIEAANSWPKLLVLVKLLKMFEQTNNKCLVFSQYQRTLDSICDILQLQDIPFLRIDGAVDDRVRKERLRKFNSDPSWGVLLMTIRVGACGLNITGANRVIIFDEGWSVIGNQAVDRVYRMGQKNDVVSYRIVSCGTVEEKMYRRQVHKTTLTELALEKNQANQRFRHWFTKEELYALFNASHVKFDTSDTHMVFQQYQPLYPQNMPEYPNWLDQHVEEIEKIDGVFGVSDHNFIIKTDLPDTTPEEENEPPKGIRGMEGLKFTKPKKTKKTKIEESCIEVDDDGEDDIVELKKKDTLTHSSSRRKEKATACYGHISRANPFVVKKCRCYLSDEEKNEYNGLVGQLKVSGEDDQKLLCLLQMVDICDDDIHVHENIALLAQKCFK